MNWNNLKENKCPNCNCKMLFRKKNAVVNIKVRKNFTSENRKDHYYFCSRCPKGFQISHNKLINVLKKQRSEINIPEKDKELFKDGLLSF